MLLEDSKSGMAVMQEEERCFEAETRRAAGRIYIQPGASAGPRGKE
jgi:hypothetical protein